MNKDHSESLLVHFRRIEALRSEALDLKAIDLTSRQLCDLELLLNRGFYPLGGYLNRTEYESVIATMRLPGGEIWPMPINLDINEQLATTLKPGERVALNDQEGFLLAILTVSDIWQPDKTLEARAVYGTDDPGLHPGVVQLFDRNHNWYVGGSLEGVSLPIHYDFRELRLSPSETARTFSMNGWRRVLGFHTEDYLHCAHREMILNAAREHGTALFLQPVADLSHPGALDYYTQIRCYQIFADKFPSNMIKLGLTPFASRKAGPVEALWQAITRKNFGCSHFMVAPDHADPFVKRHNGDRFYPLGSAQELVAKHANETGIEMVPQQVMGYQQETKKYVFIDNTVSEDVSTISSDELKRRLKEGEHIPEWFSYPEIVAELHNSFPPKAKQGFTIFMTGFSGSGKSTIAKVLLVKFMEMNDRPVTLLDGDIVRQNLSSELSFSKEHRNLNITRIGFVASEITKNGGIALCAPIAPYEESRQANRELISSYGGYVEVHVSTPLEVCEQRDRKGLYAKARAGKVKGVTGITDPYIPPSNPELTIDTTHMTPMEAVQEILLYLEEQGYFG
ncbi:bifunctional sulfate adenylyltransferase/adenylylsulfate kinase [Desulforhopalus sp. IMCC35007]|uniref:bifunctional sulfate adenylyltransferase/adenylylsulfate kinase n=1 Tax=Desulforhopalus sp. IMCC35007 TaxID=2569543 RepID=UPI0010AEDDDD|nr:bifunctional sulfate adenylyltransferase/adenylylsulfate kinase [Desulforhopalus sp. IMCC35007]TKB09439.1 bifunctional sulfate adenylyltransferase/adenylylsulfate kinase [Desulforhopalus sp. IMCC35007]